MKIYFEVSTETGMVVVSDDFVDNLVALAEKNPGATVVVKDAQTDEALSVKQTILDYLYTLASQPFTEVENY